MDKYIEIKKGFEARADEENADMKKL